MEKVHTKMKKLKICLVSLRSLPLFDESYDNEHVIGGAEINMYNLALYLSELENVEIKVLVDDFGQPGVYKMDKVELIRFGRKIGRSGGKKGILSKIAAKLTCNIKLFSINADAFIFTTANPLLGKLVLFQKVLRSKKVIFRLSSDLNIDLKNYRKNSSLGSYLMYSFGMHHASDIVSQTEKQKRLLECRLDLKSEIIENGFHAGRNVDIDKKRHILWVGRCMKSKRPLLFTELARLMPEEDFIMIMPVNKEIPSSEYLEREKLANEVYKSAERLSNVKIIDYVAYQNIQTYFDKAKCYVCTSETEGFPNTFIQAALGGTPILTYNIDPDGMVEKYHLGCFCSEEQEKAVAFIRKINNKALLEYTYAMSEYVMQKHNICVTAEKYLKLIDDSFAI